MAEEKTPQGWVELNKDARSSTIAWFSRGWTHAGGDEVLIWHGVEEYGEIHLEVPEKYEPSEDDEYVIEYMYEDELLDMMFAETLERASEKAINKIEQMNSKIE